MLDLLLTRRSVKADMLQEPGPNEEQLQQILTAAARVPDHKKLTPWRFVVFEGDARAKFGEVLAEACKSEEQIEPSQMRLETERNRLMRAPLVIALISSISTRRPVPEIEQLMSCGAAGQNMCLAANALGFGSQWITEWYSFSPLVGAALGLGERERIAGFIYIGSAPERPEDRERPSLDEIVTRWDAGDQA